MDARPGSSFTLRVLGGFELRAADGRDLTPPGKKLRALIACLALQPGKTWPRERLTALLWGDREEEQARGSLRQALAELRRVLGDGALRTDRELVALDGAVLTVDADEFVRLAETDEIAKAADLYRGDLLDGVSLPDADFGDWLLVERTRLHDLATGVLSRLLDGQSGEAAMATARRLLQLDPLREAAHRRLMQLYAVQGDRAGALRQYQVCRESLQQNLGVKPEPETERLLSEIQSCSHAAAKILRRQDPDSSAATNAVAQAGSVVLAESVTPSTHGLRSIAQLRLPHGSRRWIAGALGVILLIGVGIAVLRPPTPVERPSIVILPFRNISSDAEQGYLADGITEELTTELARIPGLLVISRDAAFHFKGDDVEPTKAAATLNVRHVLKGSIQRVNDDLRITAQLFDGGDGHSEWTERFDGKWADIFALEVRVVTEIADSMELRLPPMNPAAVGGTSNPAAYDAYLRGMELYWRFWSNSREDLGKAIPYFERAVALDPDYGQAYAGLTQVYWQAFGGLESTLGLSPQETLAKVNENLHQALKHPTARALRIAAQVPASPNRFDDAIAGLEKAIALDPSDAANYTVMAWWLVSAGRRGEAQRYLNEAFQLYPRFENEDYAGDLLGYLQFNENRFVEAAATWEKYLALYPNDPYAQILLVSAYGHLGRQEDAARHYKKANEVYFAGSGRPDFTILLAGIELPMKEPADVERLRAGWRKAKVPELPYGFDPKSKDRLTGAEIRSLIFGHRLRGRVVYSSIQDVGVQYARTTAKDGTATVSRGTVTSTNGIPLPQPHDDGYCYWFPTTGGLCWTIFRNPRGTAEQQNEYYLVAAPASLIEFSVVE